MDMFNKIRSAVTSALPGNPLSKDFDVLNQIASGGPGLSWKIYNGIKRTSKQEASVFVFEKKTLEKYSRRDKEIIIDCLKKGVSQLTRLRHPKVLSILHPLEESRETLAFATEPVFASLGNVLGSHDNLPSPIPKQLADFSLYEVEIKHGLLQVAEGITFLHHDVKLLHSNLCPENIIINRDGAWKLFGFECCIPNSNTQDQSPLFAFREWDSEIPPIAQPNLDYLAPEYALTMNCSLASDMFSIGILMHTIFNKGKSLYECKDQLSLFKKFASELQKFRSSLLGNVPNELHEYVKLLLNSEPTVRPDPDQLMKIPYFEDVGCMTLQYMDSLFQRDNLQKSQFFKGLPKIITKLPKRVSLQRILPPLHKECVNPEMVPFILPNILQIAEQSTDDEYLTHILPILKPMFTIREPPQIPLIFMQNMTLLLKKTPQGEIKNHVIPMIHLCLETESPQLQELCLSIVPTFAELIEFSSLKNSIIPRIKKLCLSTGVLAIRTNCLLCIGKLLEYLDKWTVLDDILPFLPQIPSREPAVLMSILGIYQVTLSHTKLGITKDIMATKVLPFIIPLAMDNNLNLSQFNAYMSVVRDMLGRMEKDQRMKLEQLDQMKQEQQTIQITKITSTHNDELVSGVQDEPKSMMDKFLSGFGMGSMIGGDKSAPKSNSPVPSSVQPVSTGEVVKIGEENHKVAIPISQPSKTLSIEEKQKLAKQQEQQRIYKAQKPLGTMSSTSKSPQTSRNTGVKDLSASLMSSNLVGTHPPTNKMSLNSINMTANTSSSASGTSGSSTSVFGTSSVTGNRTMGQPFMGQSSMGMSSGIGQSSMGMSGSMSQGSMGMSGGLSQNSIGMSGGMGQSSMGMSGGMGQSSMGMSGGMGQSSMGMSGGMGQSSMGMSGGMGQSSMCMSGGMGQSSMGMSGGMGQSSMGMSGNQGRNPNSMMMGQNIIPGQNMNMSSLDSLLPMSSNQQPKLSLNQMSQSSSRPQQQKPSNQFGMMGSSMGTPMAGMGQVPAVGGQSYMQNSTGMLQPMGSQQQQPMGRQGIQPMASLGMSNNSSSNDLSDIFG